MKDLSSGPGTGMARGQGAFWGRATGQAVWMQFGGCRGGQGHRQETEGEAGREQVQPGASGVELKFQAEQCLRVARAGGVWAASSLITLLTHRGDRARSARGARPSARNSPFSR